MKRNYLILLTLTLSLATEAFGQGGTTLSGKVTQAENNQPLTGALVVIDELRREARTG